MWNVFSCTDEQLSATHHRAIRALLDAAFAGDLSDDDADHAAGGQDAAHPEVDGPGPGV